MLSEMIELLAWRFEMSDRVFDNSNSMKSITCVKLINCTLNLGPYTCTLFSVL